MRTKQFAVITTSLASAAAASFDVSLHLIENLINNSAIYRKCAFTCAFWYVCIYYIVTIKE